MSEETVSTSAATDTGSDTGSDHGSSELARLLTLGEPEKEIDSAELSDDAVPEEPSVDEEHEVETDIQEAPESIPVPKSWSKEQAQIWATLPLETQKLIAEKEANASSEISRKFSEVDAQKKAVEAERAKVTAERAQYQQGLEQQALLMNYELHKIYGSVNWNELAQTQPDRYVALSQQYHTDVAEFKAIVAEQERVKGLNEHENKNVQLTALAHEGLKLAERIPELKDPVKGKEKIQEIRSYLNRSYQYSDADIATLTDSRAVEIINKAMMYDKTIAQTKTNKVAPTAPRTINNSNNVSNDGDSSQRMKQLYKQQAKYGDSDSTVALLAALF